MDIQHGKSKKYITVKTRGDKMNFYDFEVFQFDWLVVIIDPLEKKETIIVNDSEQLRNYYDSHSNDIWIGYNSRMYDQYILKGILCGFNPKQISDHIIIKKQGGWSFSSLLRNFPLNNYDVMTSMHGLKQLEGFMGNDIKETTVDFTLNRKLTEEELDETIKYCKHDVEQTIEVFFQRKEEFDAHLGLIKAFNLPLNYIGKTKPQLSAIILDCVKSEHNDEFDLKIADCIEIRKYKEVYEFYQDRLNRNYDKELKINIAGVPHIFGWGGLHGAIDKYSGDGYYLNVDVASYYPSLMIEYDFLSRNVSDPKKFKEIYETRLKYKKEKNPLQAPLKIVLNSTYGAMKDKYNNLYDPKQANNVCVNGQLMLLMLIEMLEEHCDIVQTNTDGILVKLRKYEDYDLIDDICYEWEQKTRMKLEFDLYHKIYQKDVNNYILVDFNGNMKTKGGYVKKLHSLDYDLPIINKALVNYIVNNILIEDTVNNCNELKDFQKIVKISSKYLCGWHNGKKQTDKTYRVFASTNSNDTYIGKQKSENATIEKFANTPDRCFIDNSDINNKKVPKKLDRQWYINFAYKRLKDFGIEVIKNVNI